MWMEGDSGDGERSLADPQHLHVLDTYLRQKARMQQFSRVI